MGEDKLLLKATKKGNLSIVRRLLMEERAKTEDKLERKWGKALCIACEHGHDKIVKLFLKHGVLDDSRDARMKNALINACENGHDKIVTMLLKVAEKYSLNCYCLSHRTALMYACENGHDSIVQMLLESGIYIHAVDKDGKNAFMFACQNGHEKIVLQLIKYKININIFDNENKTALMYACSEGYNDIVDILISHDAQIEACDKDKRRAISYAFNNRDETIINLLLKHRANINFSDANKKTLLMQMCEKEDCQMVELLLKHHASVVGYDDNVLVYSCMKNSLKIAELLITHGYKNQVSNYWCPVLNYVCSHDGCLEMLKLLISHGVPLDVSVKGSRHGEPKTLLMCACEKGLIEVVDLLLSQKPEVVNVNEVDIWGKSAFIYACENGHRNVVERMMKQEPEIVKINSTLRLMDAFEKNQSHTDVLLLWIKSGLFDVNASDKFDNKTVLMHACGNDCEDIVKQLILHKADINARDLCGNNALIHACYKGNLQIIRCLLEHDAEINICDSQGDTALMVACQAGFVEVVRLLLEHGANVNAANKVGETALLYACQIGIDRKLVNAFSLCVFPNKDKNFTPSHLKKRWEGGYIPIVKLLLDYKADTSASFRGQNGLIRACIIGCDPIVSMLLQQTNIDVNAGCTALFYACRVGHESIVKLLLKEAVDSDACDETGKTALIQACERGHEGIVSLLLQHNVDLSIKDSFGKTALIYAWEKGFYTIAYRLVTPGLDVSRLVNEKGNTILMAACQNGHKETVSLLINHCVGVGINSRDSVGKTALMHACSNNYFEIVSLMLRSDVSSDLCHTKAEHDKVIDVVMQCGDVNTTVGNYEQGMICGDFESPSIKTGRITTITCSEKGKTSLLTACELGEKNLNGSIDVDICGDNGKTALLLACERLFASRKIVDELIQYGADIGARDKHGKTPFMYSCKIGCEDTVDTLLERGINVHERDNEGKTALIHVCEDGIDNVRILKRLLQAGSNVNDQDVSGKTTLMYAIENKNKHYYTMRFLLKNGAHVDAHARNKQTALMVACNMGYINVVRLLKRYGADIDARDFRGQTPLMYACKNSHNSIAKLLIKYGANVNARNRNKETALMLVCNGDSDNRQLVKHLLKHKADVKVHDKGGNTAFMNACLQGHYLIADLLENHGAVVNEADAEGKTPLLYACIANKVDIVEFLILCEPEVDEPHDNYLTEPFRVACEHGYDEIVDLFIMKSSHPIDVDKKDLIGMTPLMHSSKHGRSKVVNILLNCYADVDAQSDNKMTALVYACLQGHEEVVSDLLKFGASVNISDNFGYTALIHSCQEGWSKIAKILLNHGADVNSRDNFGATAFTYCCPQWCGDVITLIFQPKRDFREDDEHYWVDNDLEQKFDGIGYHCFECVYLLIKHGLSVNTQVKSGQTAIMWIAFQSRHLEGDCQNLHEYTYDHLCIPEHLKTLLESNANLDVVDNEGHTVFSYAMCGDGNTMEVLIDSEKLLSEDGTLKAVHKNALKKNMNKMKLSFGALRVLMKKGLFEWDLCQPKMLKNVGLEALKLGICPGIVKSNGRDNSPLIEAVLQNDIRYVKHFLDNLYFLPEDYVTLRTDTFLRLRMQMKPDLKIIQELELSLEDWSFLHVSKSISLAGLPSKRAERVDALPIPSLLKQKLKFEQCRSLDLCRNYFHHEYDWVLFG